MKKTFDSFLVGIAGGSGAGKTFFIKALEEAIGKESFCLFSQDNYYHLKEKQPKDKNEVSNFDTLESIDLEQYILDLKKIKNGESITRKEYTFNNPDKRVKTLTFKPAPFLLAEGIFIFYPPELSELLDLKIFIEVPDSLRLKRRILRDNQERGYDLEDVLYRYENHVVPAYKQYIAPYREQANIILPNISNFNQGIKVLIPFFKTKLAELKETKLSS